MVRACGKLLPLPACAPTFRRPNSEPSAEPPAQRGLSAFEAICSPPPLNCVSYSAASVLCLDPCPHRAPKIPPTCVSYRPHLISNRFAFPPPEPPLYTPVTDYGRYVRYDPIFPQPFPSCLAFPGLGSGPTVHPRARVVPVPRSPISPSSDLGSGLGLELTNHGRRNGPSRTGWVVVRKSSMSCLPALTRRGAASSRLLV